MIVGLVPDLSINQHSPPALSNNCVCITLSHPLLTLVSFSSPSHSFDRSVRCLCHSFLSSLRVPLAVSLFPSFSSFSRSRDGDGSAYSGQHCTPHALHSTTSPLMLTASNQRSPLPSQPSLSYPHTPPLIPSPSLFSLPLLSSVWSVALPVVVPTPPPPPLPPPPPSPPPNPPLTPSSTLGPLTNVHTTPLTIPPLLSPPPTPPSSASLTASSTSSTPSAS